MTDDQLEPAPRRRREHPIIAGVVALVAVAAVVGGVIGGGALVATRALGLGDDNPGAESTKSQTLFLPEPTDTDNPNEDITLSPGATDGATSPSAGESSDAPTKEPPPISLSAAQTAVSSMGQIDLTGTYAEGEGAVLRVQQFEEGTWTDFPVTVNVTGGQFSTYIQTGSVGPNRFRVLDTDSGAVSNVIRVQVG